MDTNYPAATPREGYPIELAALWIRLLRQLERRGALGADPHLVGLRAHAETSFSYFVRDDLPFLSDTLHAGPGTPAREARPDDHLRPNMLTAIALGVVKGESIVFQMTDEFSPTVVTSPSEPGAVFVVMPMRV